MKHIRRKVFRCTGRKVEVSSRQIVYRRRSRKLCCSENMKSMSQKLLQTKEVELQLRVEEGGKSGEEMSLLTWEPPGSSRTQ